MEKSLLPKKRPSGSVSDSINQTSRRIPVIETVFIPDKRNLHPSGGGIDKSFVPEKHNVKKGRGWAYFDYLVAPILKDPHPSCPRSRSVSNQTADMWARRRYSLEQSFVPPFGFESDSIDQSARETASFQQALLPNSYDQHPIPSMSDSNNQSVMCTDKPPVIDRINEILRGAISGWPMSYWPSVDYLFNQEDYKLFGVTNIQELVLELGKQKKLVLFERPECNQTFAMSVPMAKRLLDFLRPIIKKLLNKHGGEIEFSSFDKFFKDMNKYEWNSIEFGLTGLDHLCDGLKDIVEVGVNSSGMEVMKLKDSVIDQDPELKKKEEKSNEKIRGLHEV